MQIERNFKKNPHTARFLMAFHTAGGTRPTGGAVSEAPATREARCLECQGFHRGGASCAPQDDNAAEYKLAADEAGDLLDLVSEAPADLRSPAQISYMEDLIRQITELDAETGAKAAEWTAKATAAGHWTPGREGTTSDWLNRLIARRDLLRTAVKNPGTAPAPVTVADGRYAVEVDGVLKFFRVRNGRKPGFVFLDVQASDDWHAIRWVRYIHQVLALIAVDAKAAMIRYGVEIGECGRCGRTLTSEYRKLGLGPICIDK